MHWPSDGEGSNAIIGTIMQSIKAIYGADPQPTDDATVVEFRKIVAGVAVEWTAAPLGGGTLAVPHETMRGPSRASPTDDDVHAPGSFEIPYPDANVALMDAKSIMNQRYTLNYANGSTNEGMLDILRQILERLPKQPG